MSNIFHFKQFSIIQDSSAMKVGTDSLLLGCFTETEVAKSILDIGTGTGLLALMMAQKSDANIVAVEIDQQSFDEALLNFNHSVWKDRLQIVHQPIGKYVLSSNQLFDLIITNPPYFKADDNFKIDDKRRSLARQDHELTFDLLCKSVYKLLNTEGALWLILPSKEAHDFESVAFINNLFLYREIRIYPKAEKAYNRMVMCFKKQFTETLTEDFYIYDETGKPTTAYFELTKEFLLWEE